MAIADKLEAKTHQLLLPQTVIWENSRVDGRIGGLRRPGSGTNPLGPNDPTNAVGGSAEGRR